MSQAPETGKHCKIDVSNTAIPQAMTSAMNTFTTCENRLLTPNRRRYKHRTEVLMQVTMDAE